MSKKLGLALGIAFLLLGSAAFAGEVVKVTVEPDAVYFVPNANLERGETTVTVSGPEDCFVERDYKEREVGVFKIIDDQGDLIPDGEYAYHVTFRPILSARDRNTLADARLRNDPLLVKKLRKAGIVRKTLADSGYIHVVEGQFVFEQPTEGRARAQSGNVASSVQPMIATPLDSPNDGLVAARLFDFVINDDLIVDGSACIGFDCVNGESFGFDTIRLKENNLRIKFDDTSTAASFPRNDWQLTANASANGGASKFSIDDISGNRTPFTVEANARNNSLYVDDGGRIGNRTSTPAVEIHTIDGDTPTLRLQQDGSSGFAPQTWDLAGNETNFFVRDVTNGSTLPFRIRPGAPTSAIFIDVDGDVGIGTSSPDEAFHLERTGATDAVFKIQTATGLPRILLDNGDSASKWLFDVSDNQDFRISVDGSGAQEFLLTETGDLTITGNLITGGGGTCDPGPCDGTFTWYEVESIEDHAAYMWENKHLWGVGPTPEGEPLNISSKTTGILHELEKAHIYIEQLNDAIKDKSGEISALLDRIEDLEARTAGDPR